MRFTEVEHKFVVGEDFDLARFRATMLALGPTRTFALRVLDRYFLTDHSRAHGYVIRHRYDEALHHLTIKALESDPEVRDEINLDLGQHAGDQADTVDAFVARLGATWRGDVVKDIEVWEFPTCEVVHYTASAGDHAGHGDPAGTGPATSRGRVVRCVEFEAVHAASVEAAREVLELYERAAAFDAATRSLASLVDLLFPAVLSREHPPEFQP